MGTLFAFLLFEKNTKGGWGSGRSFLPKILTERVGLRGDSIMTRKYLWVGAFVLASFGAILAGNPVQAQTGGSPGSQSKSPSAPSSSPDGGMGVAILSGLLSHFTSRSASATSASVRDDSQRSEGPARIWLLVPGNAQVWFNGQETKLTGRHRRFLSPPLIPGKSYTYKIRVRWMKDGKAVVEERSIEFRAGESVPIDFTQPDDRVSATASQGAVASSSGVKK
jgi:uncharacterized protein (TIGR03000 family)